MPALPSHAGELWRLVMMSAGGLRFSRSIHVVRSVLVGNRPAKSTNCRAT